MGFEAGGDAYGPSVGYANVALTELFQDGGGFVFADAVAVGDA